VIESVRDSDWSESHISNHAVTMQEVREVVLERPFWITPGRNNTQLIFGKTYSGRHLLVVAVIDDGEAFIVTARPMTQAERKTFRRKAQ
jgi:uncharacterized protein